MGEESIIFKRYEKKYLLTEDKYRELMEELEPYLEPDEYFSSTVCSLYYDSEDFSLIRRSIEAPPFKEKLRLRCYSVPKAQDEVFLELKKKFRGVVYKRRVSMEAAAAEDFLSGKAAPPEDNQIIREIHWFLKENKPVPKIFIACDRKSYRAKDDARLRITFDSNLRWRQDRLSLTEGADGELLTEGGRIIMEIKIPQAAPVWLASMLSRHEIFPVGYSKYGSCYREGILEKYLNGVIQ